MLFRSPEQNIKDLVEISDEIKKQLDIIPVRWIDDVLEVALTRKPEPVKAQSKSKQTKKQENILRVNKSVRH